jgi:hypothetical protein
MIKREEVGKWFAQYAAWRSGAIDEIERAGFINDENTYYRLQDDGTVYRVDLQKGALTKAAKERVAAKVTSWKESKYYTEVGRNK